MGHTAEYCRQRSINKEKMIQGTCFKCGKQGHIARNCTQQVAEKPKCTHCGKIGHTQNQCWQKNGRPTNQNGNMQFQGKKIIGGKPVRVFYAEDDEEPDTQLQLADAINQLTAKLNLKV
jgi:hypothetical protein